MRIAHLGAVLAAAAAVGCGGGDDEGSSNADRYDGAEADVAKVVDDFANAGRDGDGEKVCEDIFALPLAKNVEREAKQSCTSEVEDNLPEGKYELEVDDIDVQDATATAEVTDQDDNRSVLHFIKDGDEWRILRVTEAP